MGEVHDWLWKAGCLPRNRDMCAQQSWHSLLPQLNSFKIRTTFVDFFVCVLGGSGSTLETILGLWSTATTMMRKFCFPFWTKMGSVSVANMSDRQWERKKKQRKEREEWCQAWKNKKPNNVQQNWREGRKDREKWFCFCVFQIRNGKQGRIVCDASD